MLATDHVLYQVEGFFLVLVIVGFVLRLLTRRLADGRPGLHLEHAIITAVGVRVLASVAIALLPIARNLRGTDELVFLANARSLASGPLASLLTGRGITPLHQWVFAAQIRLFDASDLTLRVTQIGFAVAGLALIATAVHDLAGARAATLAAWLLAFEPTNVFFSSFLHKEPLMMLGEGLVAYGGARMWARRGHAGLGALVGGCVIATATRPYAGWFLTAAALAIALHVTMLRGDERRSRLLTGLVVCVLAGGAAVAIDAAPAQLQRLQQSQDANTSDTSNLKYEKVDYSTLGAVVANLPLRVSDFLLKPYPWQVANTSQQLGLVGGIVTLVALWLLIVSVVRKRRRAMDRAGPLMYVGASLLVAYAVTAGNAGTAFRLRTHVVALAICLVAAVRRTPVEEAAELRSGDAREPGSLPATSLPADEGLDRVGLLT